MARLNPNQLNSRSRTILTSLNVNGQLPDADQLYYILEKSGIIAHIEDYLNLATRPADDPPKQIDHVAMTSAPSFDKIEDLQAARDEIIAAMFERAKGGDVQAAKAFADISSEDAPTDRFNITLNVTPYRIKDESLKGICLQAEPPVVDECLSGLDLRMEIDEAPHELRELCRQFRTDFAAWAAEAYKPKDVV